MPRPIRFAAAGDVHAHDANRDDLALAFQHVDGTVDLIFDPSGVTIDDEFVANAPLTEVHAVRMRVLRPEDVLVTKLLAMREHSVDYEPVLEIARSVREQIDWDEVRERTRDSPYAKAFFTLVDELELSA